MKNSLIYLLLFCGGCAQNVNAQQNNSLSDFNRIKIEGAADVELFQADRHSIYVDTREEAGNKVDHSVNNGTLVIESKSSGRKKNPLIKVYFKDLRQISTEGFIQVSSKDTITAERFSVSTEGGGKNNLILNVNDLQVTTEGIVNNVFTGKAVNFTLNATGAGRTDASNLITENATAQVEGICKVSIHASEMLNAKAEGSSNITFHGAPKTKNIAVDGISKVVDANGDEFAGTSQTSKDYGDTTRFKIGKRKLMIIEDNAKDDKKEEQEDPDKRRRMKRVYAGFEMGVNSMTTPSMNFAFSNQYKFLNTKMGESWFFGLNIFETDGHIIRNKLAVTTGFGMQWSNYHFEGNNSLTPNSDTLGSIPSAAGVSLSKNKLFTYDLNVPLMLKFAPGNKQKANAGFHLAAGAIFRYVATASVVTESSSGGFDQHTKISDDFNINPFRVDATVRVGYNKLKLFANYALTPYFNASKAPDVRVFSAGLMIIGF